MTGNRLEHYRVLELSGEAGEAVDQLWAAGKVAIALRLLLEDCERLRQALRSVPGAADDEGAWLETLCQTGFALGVPALERDLSPAHRELLAQLAAGRRRSVALLRGSEPRSRRWRLRAWCALAILAVAVAVLVFRNVATAHASGVYSNDFPASQAVDGLTKTEWLLPDKQTGFLELVFSRPRAVQSLRLLNASNSPFSDRATKAFKLEAFADTRLIATAKGEFPPIAKDEGAISIPLQARDVTHVRITISSFYGLGGGLAEVQVR